MRFGVPRRLRITDPFCASRIPFAGHLTKGTHVFLSVPPRAGKTLCNIYHPC